MTTTGPDDVVAGAQSVGTVAALYTMIGFAVAGVPLRMIDLTRGGFRHIFACLRSDRSTLLRLGVSAMRAMASLPDAAASLATVRVVGVFGEPLSRADVALFKTVLPPDCIVFTLYGATEASGTVWYASPDDDQDPVRCPVGLVRSNVEIRISDDDGNAVPPGGVGELWIRGAYVVLGQWRDGELVPGKSAGDPERPAWRMHRTGDLARIGSDGVLVILGRKDRMALINGQRVEPAEVEAALRALPGIMDAAVLHRTQADRT